jgi:membrane peptidoglycan carboxypeptidase
MQDLSVRQAAYLISLLPGPHSYHRFFERGEVPAWEEDYLDLLVRSAGNRGALTSEDEERALGERISFPGRPGA